MSRTTLMGAIAIRQALEQAGLSVSDLASKRVALISGTTVGGMDLTENYYEQMKTDDSLLYLPKSNECGKSTEEMAEIVDFLKEPKKFNDLGARIPKGVLLVGPPFPQLVHRPSILSSLALKCLRGMKWMS